MKTLNSSLLLGWWFSLVTDIQCDVSLHRCLVSFVPYSVLRSHWLVLASFSLSTKRNINSKKKNKNIYTHTPVFIIKKTKTNISKSLVSSYSSPICEKRMVAMISRHQGSPLRCRHSAAGTGRSSSWSLGPTEPTGRSARPSTLWWTTPPQNPA